MEGHLGWVGSSPLLNLALQLVSWVDSYKRVIHYWVPREGWNWTSLAGLPPNRIEDIVHAM